MDIFKDYSQFNTMIHETSFHKPQRFVFRNGLAKEEYSDEKGTKFTRARDLTGNDMLNYNTAPILKFEAYYCDKSGEGHKPITRYRKCNVLYYLEDDEMKIFEPPQKNSGLPQGCIVRKGLASNPEGGYYTIDDLNIGESLFVNGREYKLTNCDSFTRRFLTEMGYRVRSPEPDVVDPITEDRNEMNSLRSYSKPHVKKYKSASFFKNHPKRLRFFGYFEDERSFFKDKREVTLYYDLAQETIKLVEEGIDGICDTRVLLKPTLVPKRMKPCPPIGEMCDTTLLNLAHDVKNVLIGGQYYKMQNLNSYIVDSNPVEGTKSEMDYYKDVDLHLAEPLNIFGFKVLLHDCDEFTKNYYRSTYGEELIPLPRHHEEAYHSHQLVYKHEGFGSPEQTIRTINPLKSKPYNIDLLKFFKNDRYAYDVRELKFLARALTEDPVEELANFTVCFMLEDDTMAIRTLELEGQNRNAVERTYLHRMKVTKPQSVYENAGRCFYRPDDMYVGNVIHVRGKAFLLVEANEYTYDYMEKNSDRFAFANVRLLMNESKEWASLKCESLKSAFEKHDPEKKGIMKYNDFRDVLYSEMPDNIKVHFPEHALKTLARYYAEEDYIGLLLDDLVRKVKTELYKKRFYDFGDLKLAFKKQDLEKKGFLDTDRIYYVLRSTSLPINRDLLKSLIYKFPKTENQVNYIDLIETLDWIHHPAEYDKGEPHAIQINWERKETKKNLDKIKYICFLMDVLPS